MWRRLSLIAVAVFALTLAWALAGLMAGGDGISSHAVVEFGTVPGSAEVVAAPRDSGVLQREVAVVVPGSEEPVQVPVRSGLLGALDADEGPVPVRLHVGALAIDAPVEPVGFDAATGGMEVPGSADVVGWYHFGPSPGEHGSAVLAAHVDWYGRAGVFYALYTLETGSVLTVEYDDGSQQLFEVVAGREYRKEVLPTDDLFRRDGAPTLALITCGGSFDRANRSYDENVVVYAVPFDAVAQPATAT